MDMMDFGADPDKWGEKTTITLSSYFPNFVNDSYEWFKYRVAIKFDIGLGF